MSFCTLGVECKLGDGYNKRFRRIIPFDGKPKEETEDKKVNGVQIRGILDCETDLTNIFGHYLERSGLRIIDFRLTNDNEKCWCCRILVYKRKIESKEFERYPENTSHHITGMHYGMYFEVIVRKQHLPNDKDKLKKLLESAVNDVNELNETQKKIKCRVLINTLTVLEMTMFKLFKYIDDFRNGKFPELEKVVAVEIKRHKDSPRIIVKDKSTKLLTYLYHLYRRIEIKLEASGYHLHNVELTGTTSIRKIVNNLQKAESNYKDMDGTNFFKMYPVLKELFWKCVDYLRICIDNNSEIDLDQDLIDRREDIVRFLNKIRNWSPVLINNEWYETENEELLIIPIDSNFSFDKITSIKKYTEIGIKMSDTVTEPYLHYHKEINGYFGFIKMEGPFDRIVNQKDWIDFKESCPLKCSEDKRKWICSHCGDTVRSYGIHLSCSCGIKLFEKEMLECCNPEHELKVLARNLPENLRVIVQQLKKYENSEIMDSENIQKIKEARKQIIYEPENADIRSVINELRNLNVFDGDTMNVFDQYLDKSQ